MDVRKRLAMNMKRLRKEKKLSQEALAHEAGLDRTFVSQIERCRKNVTLPTVEKIAKALGVTVGALVDEVPPDSEIPAKS